MTIPYDNWQFWAATVIVIAALAWLVRSVSPALRRRRRHRRRVRLTVHGRAVR
jgi:hypothetical protein